MDRITALEQRVDMLEKAFLQSQKNQVTITDKTDSTAVKVEELTPYTESKTAYIDDTEVVFENVPQGNLTIYLNKPYTVEREDSRVTVRFEALEEVTEITISIIGG